MTPLRPWQTEPTSQPSLSTSSGLRSFIGGMGVIGGIGAIRGNIGGIGGMGAIGGMGGVGAIGGIGGIGVIGGIGGIDGSAACGIAGVGSATALGRRAEDVPPVQLQCACNFRPCSWHDTAQPSVQVAGQQTAMPQSAPPLRPWQTGPMSQP